MMKELTFEEFVYLLNNKCDNFEDNGSSRAVFNFCYEGVEYVIKLAGDRQGRCQNRIERDYYKDSGEASYLNPIVAYFQDIMLVSEWVNVMDCSVAEAAYEKNEEDFIEWCIEYAEDYAFDCMGVETKDDAAQLYNDLNVVMDNLAERLDDSSDNYQLGTNPNGNGYGVFNIVSYDYGFDANEECNRNDMIGNIESYLHYDNIDNSELFDRIWYYINKGEDESYSSEDDCYDEDDEEECEYDEDSYYDEEEVNAE